MLREKQNWIGGGNIYQARFVPPPGVSVGKCMADLEAFLGDVPGEADMYEVPIVVRMAIAHAQFEMIHPFLDGNGRVGRLILPLMLAAEGYPPVYIAGYLKNNQREYYDALSGVQLRENWPEWICFLATAVKESVAESINTAIGLNTILRQWEEKISRLRLRSDSVIHKLPKYLVGTPVVSARQVEQSLGVSFPSANNALAKLSEIGILVNPKDQPRYRIFVAKEVVDLLNWML